ncbi:MAG: ATP-binding cassette domain-containing protein [Deltaproteobacteria bacterium]|nr:ATP-binding cassette domain-containing protein [Deltaproteobacteria bacterium]MBW2137266.1 ATP-binding cassette domain-containing protein [Deltaproteobacteria bacterium]
MDQILEIKGLRKYFPIAEGGFFKTAWVKAVDNISFSVQKGQTFALVGESGCGKTTTARIILLLDNPTAGIVLFCGKNIFGLNPGEIRQYRSSVQAVFQDPYSSLSPRLRVGAIISEPLRANRKHLTKAAIQEKVNEVLLQVGLDPEMATLFPHEFSGGQRQRIAIARSLVQQPSLIVLDEPVSALDISMQAQIMNLLKELQDRLKLSYLLIAHNLATVRYMSHAIGIMYLGKLVEKGASEAVFAKRLHPYTQALFSAALPTHPDLVQESPYMLGEVPSALNPPPGCRFHPRCSSAKPICSRVEPELKMIAPGHEVACLLC